MENSKTALPVVLQPIFVERVWGAYDLGAWHAAGSLEKPIGEIWLTAEECNVSGSGETLKDLVTANPEAYGNHEGAGFPLLIKLLFPREKLSVQVHPNDTEAREMGQPRGKTECWYVLSAEEGAQVAVGLRQPMSPAQLRDSIASGAIESDLRMLPVKSGDMVFVEAGTVHAIGPAMVVLETQQYCDVTYRLWDYGRPRELHLDAGLAVTKAETASGMVAAVAMEGFDRLVSSRYFVVDRFGLNAGEPAELERTSSVQIVIATSGRAALEGNASRTDLPVGHAVVLPAGSGPWSLRSEASAEVIRVLDPVVG